MAKQDKKKKPRGCAYKRMQYNRRFVTAVIGFGPQSSPASARYFQIESGSLLCPQNLLDIPLAAWIKWDPIFLYIAGHHPKEQASWDTWQLKVMITVLKVSFESWDLNLPRIINKKKRCKFYCFILGYHFNRMLTFKLFYNIIKNYSNFYFIVL